jgi:4-amino-4-deoxy-L-arabinose transferase-like glycosyltransferase
MFFVSDSVHPQTQNRFRAPRAIFWAALAGRIAYILLFHSFHFRLDSDHFQYGWEMGRIARALATGYGYADPFIGHTGPTAWVPPLYPLIIAAGFKVFGVYTLKAAFALLALNSVFSALTALLVYEIGARCFGPHNALWSAWIWALYPAAGQYATRWLWEMTLTTLLFTAVIVLALRMRRIGENKNSETSNKLAATGDPQSLRRWALFGLLWGLIALSNSTLLLFLPVCTIWILLGAPQLKRSLKGTVLAAVVCCVILAPWVIRNQRVFHSFIPLRGNFGAELYLGDGPGSTGYLMIYDHPFQSPDQLRLYREMGEVRYVRMRDELARQTIRANPAHFLADTAIRTYFFWAGVPRAYDHPGIEAMRTINFSFISLAGLMGLALALHRRMPAATLFAWAFLLLPLTYYFVTVHARFRHPLEPLICVLGVYLFQSASTQLPNWFGGSPAPSN